MQHLKPRSTTVVLYQGDDMDRLAELKRAVDIAKRIATQKESSARLGDDDQSVADAENAYDGFVDEAAERALEVELRSIGRRRFRDLLLEHPPRQVPKKVAPPAEGETAAAPEMVDHEDDASWGINSETFPQALLCYRDGETVTIARPEFASATAVREFIDDELADGDFEQLWVAAYMLNRSPSGDPKAVRFSTTSQSSDES